MLYWKNENRGREWSAKKRNGNIVLDGIFFTCLAWIHILRVHTIRKPQLVLFHIIYEKLWPFQPSFSIRLFFTFRERQARLKLCGMLCSNPASLVHSSKLRKNFFNFRSKRNINIVSQNVPTNIYSPCYLVQAISFLSMFKLY